MSADGAAKWIAKGKDTKLSDISRTKVFPILHGRGEKTIIMEEAKDMIF